MIRETLVYLKKNSDVRRCHVYVVRHTAAMTSPLINLKIAVKVSTNAYWNTGDGPLEKYRRVLKEKVNVTSNKRGFGTNNRSVTTYEQVQKGLFYFCSK